MSEVNRDAFDDYVKLRFDHRTRDYKQLAADKKNFYCRRVEDLLQVLGFKVRANPDLPADERAKAFETALLEVGIQIVTIRTAFDEGSPLLKPVATFPEERLRDAEDIAHNQKPRPFCDAGEALRWSEPEKSVVQERGTDGGGSTRFSGIYKFGSIPAKTPLNEKQPTIAFRIEQAIRNARKANPQKVSGPFAIDPVCFFSVATSQAEDHRLQIDKIVAIYWKNTLDHEVSKDAVELAHQRCATLFDEILQIQMIDNQLFELEGHELVSSLQPTFLNPKVAPADKIAFAIAKLKSLLQKHLDSHYPATDRNKVNPDVYFVSVSYEAISEKHQDRHIFKPLFQVYPHIFRKDHALSAYYISRPDEVSVTKLLLKRYFDWRSEDHENGKPAQKFVLGPSALLGNTPKLAAIDKHFTDTLFKDFEKANGKLCTKKGLTIDFDEDNGDQIFVSKAKDAPQKVANLYSNLNVAVKGRENENSSIIAYVIEGRELEKQSAEKVEDPPSVEKYQQLPRAILAIEGQREELFSNAERMSLRVVAVAFSNLVRHSFHDNSLLDYRSQLSEAYARFFSLAKAEDQPRFSRFLLASMAVDVSLLIEIKKRLIESGDELPKNLEFVLKEVFKGTESPDEDTPPSIVNKKLRERFERALRFAEKAAETNQGPEYKVGQDLVDFIEACPRNFAWAGYAPSLAEALGDRAEHSPPSFRLMTPGFSASGLYMAVVRSEIRQVAKLASLKKLNKEHRNYRSFVRYKLVLAARMANNAVAFDSRGGAGLKQGSKDDDTFFPASDYEKYCYGVLVSDLASSRKLGAKADRGIDNQVSTLQDLAWNAIIGIKSAGEEVLFPNIKRAIEQLFGSNLGHWFMLHEAEELKDGAWQGLARAFRLNYEEREDSGVRRVSDDQSEFLIAEKFQSLLREDKPCQIFESVLYKDDEDRPNPVLLEKRKGKGIGDHQDYIAENTKSVVLRSKSLFQFSKIGLHRALSLPRPENLAEEFGSVVHGDLNARNLVWAGPIEHLVMIDFEHTTVGLMGVDQARLAVNLVVDHMAPYSARADAIDPAQRPGQLDAQIKSVRKAADFLIEYILNQGSTRPETKAAQSKRKPKQENNGTLADIVAAVLSSLGLFFEDRDDPDHISVLIHALAMALIKEYEYGIKNITRARLDPSQVRSFLEAKEQSKGSLEGWLTKLFTGTTFPQSSRGKEQLTSVARYAITFWVLERIIDQVEFKE
jgi:hypothetical protein